MCLIKYRYNALVLIIFSIIFWRLAKADRPAVQACKDIEKAANIRNLSSSFSGASTEYPHMALIAYDSGQIACGGVLIDKRFVLTTGYCASNQYMSPINVILGVTDTNDTQQWTLREEVPIKATHFHPNYKSFSPYDNIGLIELTRDVSYSESVFPVCLNTEPSNFTGDTELILAAWNNSLTEDSKKRLQLLSATVKSIPNAQCNELYAPVPRLSNGIDGSLICASPPLRGLCHRRVLGALHILKDASYKNYKVVGIDAFGPTVCGIAIPDTFIRVVEYLDFIESVVWPRAYKKRINRII